MNLIRLVAWKEFVQIRADPLLSKLIVFPVFVQLFVFAYALTLDIRNTPVGVVDWSRSPESASLVAEIAANPLFRFRGMLDDAAHARAALDRGAIRLAIVLPADFAPAVESQAGEQVQLIGDGSDANAAGIAAGYMGAVINRWAVNRFKERLERQGVDIRAVIPVSVRSTVLFNPRLSSVWYMVPALVVLLVTIITSLLTAFSIVKEKESGTLEQLLVTPIRPIHIIAGKAAPFIVIGMAQIMLFLLIATLWFRIPFRGSVLTLLAFGLLYMVSSLGIGILVSSVARTPQQVLFLTWFILIFFILLGGFFIPVENMPAWVQYLTIINPVRFYMFVVRAIFLKGLGFADLWQEGAIMLGIGAVVFTLALVSFHRRVG